MALYVPCIDVPYFKSMQWLKDQATNVCGRIHETDSGKCKRMDHLKNEVCVAYKLFFDEKGQIKHEMVESVFGCPNSLFEDKTGDEVSYKGVRVWKSELEAKLFSSTLQDLYMTHEWPTDSEHGQEVRELFKKVASDILKPWKDDSMYPKLTKDDTSLKDVVDFVFKRTRGTAVKDYLLHH